MIRTKEDVKNLIESQSRNIPKLYIQNKKDMYYDRWDYIIETELKDQFSEKARQRLRLLKTKEFNLLKQIVNRLSIIYKTPPERKAVVDTVESEDGMQPIYDEKYTQVIDQGYLNVVLKKVNVITNRDNHMLLQPVWRNEHIEYNLHTFDNCELYTKYNNKNEIAAIKYYTGLRLPYYGDTALGGEAKLSREEFGSSRINKTYAMYESYSKSYVYYRKESGEIWIAEYDYEGQGQERFVKEERCPYSINGKDIFPFVLFSKSMYEDCLLNFSEGDDILDATINVAVQMAHLNELMKYQSHIQGILSVDDASKIGEKLNLGAGEIAVLQNGGDSGNTKGDTFKTIDLQSKYKELWDTIKERMSMIMAQYGISPQNYTLSGAPSSGYTLKISNQALLERRQNDIDFYRMYEKQLFAVTRAINNYHNNIKINENAQFSIDFGEVDFQNSPTEEASIWGFRFANNLSTPVDYIMDKNPDLTREGAEKLYSENIQYNNMKNQRATTQAQQPTAVQNK